MHWPFLYEWSLQTGLFHIFLAFRGDNKQQITFPMTIFAHLSGRVAIKNNRRKKHFDDSYILYLKETMDNPDITTLNSAVKPSFQFDKNCHYKIPYFLWTGGLLANQTGNQMSYLLSGIIKTLARINNEIRTPTLFFI